MADNRTSAEKLAGNSAGPGQTASGNPQTFQAGQDAILAAQRQQELATQRQAEAAFRAASRRAGGELDIMAPTPGMKVQYTGLPGTAGANVSGKRGKKGK
jgi:hypothetical protein